jgi:hypothetical protein
MPPDEARQFELRQKALEFLRADLRFITQWMKEEAAPPLSTWQVDPALTSVHDPGELAKLPDTEREQWQLLWADVGSTAARQTAAPSESASP